MSQILIPTKGGFKMILLENPVSVATTTLLLTNKLKNMHLHLTELVNKKYRISLEIKSLTKILAKKQREYEKSLKLKISAESSLEPISPESQILLETNYPEIHQAILEFDARNKAIEALLREIEEELL